MKTNYSLMSVKIKFCGQMSSGRIRFCSQMRYEKHFHFHSGNADESWKVCNERRSFVFKELYIVLVSDFL